MGVEEKKGESKKKIKKGRGAASIISLAWLSSYANQSSGSGTFLTTATESLSVPVLIKLRSIGISQGKSLFRDLG